MSYAPLPTAGQAYATHARIAARKDEKRRIEGEIEDLEGRITTLRGQVAVIQHELDIDEAFVAPIRRLPPEILGNIIALAATAPGTDVQVLRTLSSICRLWRDTTLRTPSAWSRIVFATDEVPTMPRRVLHNHQDVEEWFNRAGSSTKDLALSFGDNVMDGSQDDQRDLVLQHASELRSFALRSSLPWHDDDGRLARLHQTYLRRPFPLLEAFDTGDSFHPSTHDCLSVLDAPRLHSLVTCGLVARLPQDLRSRLKALSVRRCDPLALVPWLHEQGGLPALRGLRFRGLPYVTGPPRDDLQVHSNVEVLQLHVMLRYATAILRCLRLPRLSKLAIAAADIIPQPGSAAQAFTVLETLLDRSAPRLRELYLHRISIEDADFVNVLRQLPTLERLVVLYGTTSDNAMQALSYTKSVGACWLCPHLVHLCISSAPEHSPGVSRSAMESLVTARRNDAERCLTQRGMPSSVRELLFARLGDAELTWDGTVWSWIERVGIMRYAALPDAQAFDTAWAQVESLL